MDLDGTLVRTDLFLESVLKLIKQNPINIFNVIIWTLRGRSVVKALVARKIKLDPRFLPYEEELVDYIKRQKTIGRTIILATASHWTYAKRVADYLGLFDHVIASTSKNNLKGEKKLAKIQEGVCGAPFCYAGDSAADRPIWAKASSNILVNASSCDVDAANSRDACEKVVVSRRSVGRAFIKEMRPHQWAKNLLIFAPLLAAHQYMEVSILLFAAWAFLCFSLCASGVYFLNDFLDLEADRRHPRKKLRPLACGDLPIMGGALGAIGLPLVSFILAGLVLPAAFLAVLVSYYLITNAYSFFLKRISTADVMTLAVLYTLRVIAGAAAISVDLSSWLLAFSMFIFVSLAYLKRYIEISELDPDAGVAHGRGYSNADSETMFALGIANATASVLVLALYVSSEEITSLYQEPRVLWLLCLILLYWCNRVWVGARRGKITDDPVVFAIKDRVSRMAGVCAVIVVVSGKLIEL